jgi:predicted nuclease of predicted toxin-antitoxin system
VRLLFDEQLSEDLLGLLADLFPESLRVRGLSLGGASDSAVWQIAKERDCILVTKDEDFHRLSVLRGALPKVIWLRLGNCTTEDAATVIRRRVTDIRQFAEQEETTVLELG